MLHHNTESYLLEAAWLLASRRFEELCGVSICRKSMYKRRSARESLQAPWLLG